jgi:transposase
MPIDADPLPDEIDTLRLMVIEEREARAAREAELEAAKAGLVSKTLEIEKLKIQIARLRRRLTASSSSWNLGSTSRKPKSLSNH